jgi:hypothetical protein
MTGVLPLHYCLRIKSITSRAKMAKLIRDRKFEVSPACPSRLAAAKMMSISDSAVKSESSG